MATDLDRQSPAFALAQRSYEREPRVERHEHLQVVLPLSGALEMTVGGVAGTVAGQHWAVVAPGTPHTFAGRGANRFLVADFHGDLAAGVIDSATAPFRLLDARGAALLALLRLEDGDGSLAEPVVAEGLGRYAHAALGLSTSDQDDHRENLGPSGRTVARVVRAFLDDAWAEPIALADAAAAACCSPAHATRCFRAAYGIGPVAYLQRVRVAHARRLLETTDLSAGEVALRVGFSSQPWFTRLFAREVGMPPAAYRSAVLHESGKRRPESGKP